MLDRFRYPGTTTLKNRFGVQDPAAANELEAAAYANRRPQPVPKFTPDLAGLKAVHQHLFQDIYEWAGKTRGERVTIDGETFTPREHYLSKGDTQFGHSSETGKLLQDQLLILCGRMDDLQRSGHLSKEAWAAITADQIGTINAAHPFNEGNGRTMRRFIELSAEHYGFQARIIGGPQWMMASHNAMDFRLRDGLQDFIAYNTTTAAEADAGRPIGTDSSKEAPMVEASTMSRKITPETLRKAAAVNSVAARAVAQIQDPQRRAEAQQLLDGMRTIEAKQRNQAQGRSTDKPEAQRQESSRDRGQDFDR